jgi:hypothetical protein
MLTHTKRPAAAAAHGCAPAGTGIFCDGRRLTASRGRHRERQDERHGDSGAVHELEFTPFSE